MICTHVATFFLCGAATRSRETESGGDFDTVKISEAKRSTPISVVLENRPAESFVRRRSPIASSFTKSRRKRSRGSLNCKFVYRRLLSLAQPWRPSRIRLQSGCWRMAPCWRSPRRSARIPRTAPFFFLFSAPPVLHPRAPPRPKRQKVPNSGRLQRTSIAGLQRAFGIANAPSCMD